MGQVEKVQTRPLAQMDYLSGEIVDVELREVIRIAAANVAFRNIDDELRALHSECLMLIQAFFSLPSYVDHARPITPLIFVYVW